MINLGCYCTFADKVASTCMYYSVFGECTHEFSNNMCPIKLTLIYMTYSTCTKDTQLEIIIVGVQRVYMYTTCTSQDVSVTRHTQ